MKWSYTSGEINVSSEEDEQQFLLKDLIDEASKHQARKKKSTRRIFKGLLELLFVMEFIAISLKISLAFHSKFSIFLIAKGSRA